MRRLSQAQRQATALKGSPLQRHRQRNAQDPAAGRDEEGDIATHRDKVDQARANLLKTVRTAIRHRHSINADNEINEVLPEVERRFNAAVMRGQLPEPIDIQKALKL